MIYKNNYIVNSKTEERMVKKKGKMNLGASWFHQDINIYPKYRRDEFESFLNQTKIQKLYLKDTYKKYGCLMV